MMKLFVHAHKYFYIFLSHLLYKLKVRIISVITRIIITIMTIIHVFDRKGMFFVLLLFDSDEIHFYPQDVASFPITIILSNNPKIIVTLTHLSRILIHHVCWHFLLFTLHNNFPYFSHLNHHYQHTYIHTHTVTMTIIHHDDYLCRRRPC